MSFEKFSEMLKELRETMAPKSYIILCVERLLVKIDGKPAICCDLELKQYHLLKSLAHRLVFYSIKHGKRYEKLTDLCEKLRPTDHFEFFNHTVDQLMELASKQYLSELHRVVQLFREDGEEWPAELLCLVCGPASPRFGHPAMQYFARLTNTRLEQRCSSCQGRDIQYEPSDENRYPGRKLFYIENVQSSSEALQIGTSLLVEQTVLSQYADMSVDILAANAMQHLKTVCGK
mgnify:CR=1 FL=1